MQRELERRDDLIDLGAASAETKGFGGVAIDEALGQVLPGLTDD